jgi:FkbM family methyltransferase
MGEIFVLTRLALVPLTFYLRHFPSERGRWRIVPVALRWAQAALPDEYRRIRTRDGFALRVRLTDWLGRYVYVTGEYEPATKEVIKALLSLGDAAVDVGANVGYFTLLASRRVGPGGRVFAFEPAPATRQDLEANVRLNDAANVVVRSEALSNKPGETTFNLGPQDHPGTSSLRSLANGSERVTVTTACLDDLLPQGVRVNLIKIDVEGAEYLALLGMRECLQRDHPDLVIEVTDKFLREMGHSAEHLCADLFALGYKMYVIRHEGLKPVRSPAEVATGQHNALFTTRQSLPAPLRVVDG